MNIQDAYDHVPSTVKVAADALSITVVVGTLFDHLPTIAAGLSVIWSVIRIYETKTVQRFLARFKRRTPDNSN